MNINKKLITPITETKYLTAENADRYRSIIRCFYLNYEKLKYWMYQEEVYEELKKWDYFTNYTAEQCQQDLTSLTTWKNLITIQDTRKVSTIEEFKNRKFRYQLSEYSVEIERMVIRLENLVIEGASLEPNLLERIYLSLSNMQEVAQSDNEYIYSWWNDLNSNFVRLNQNYQDYMHELNSIKAEEMMKTKEFLLFKDKLIQYLRNFVRSLQINVSMIEQYLKKMDQQYLTTILDKIIEYELSIPRMEVERTKEMIQEKIIGRWNNLQIWFLGQTNKSSEVLKIFDTTNEIIRKITRYANRISEQSNSGANRRKEYYKLAAIFGQCSDIKKAHQLAANVFGIEHPIHFKGEIIRKTDSINSSVFEESPLLITVSPRIRNYREKSKRTEITTHTLEKKTTREAALIRILQEKKLLQSYIKGNCLDFASLPVLEPYTRDIFLNWLSKALEHKNYSAKTEDGQYYYIEKANPDELCTIICTDGTFTMPAFSIIFEKE